MSSPSRDLYVGAALRIGRFVCGPAHPRWAEVNLVGPWPLLAFPGTAVEIVQDGCAPVVANASRVILYNPRQSYRRRLLDRRGDDCVYVSAAPELVGELVGLADPSVVDRGERCFVVDHAPVDARLAAAVPLLARHLELAESIDALLIEERLVALLAALLSAGPRGRARALPPGHRELTRELERQLSLHFAAPRSLTEIAAAAGCSPFHAARVFRAGTGLTIHGYRHRLRLHAALRGLDDPGVDLTQLALETGFCSHSHLTEAFRRALGAPPSRWRGRLSGARLRALCELLWRGGSRARS